MNSEQRILDLEKALRLITYVHQRCGDDMSPSDLLTAAQEIAHEALRKKYKLTERERAYAYAEYLNKGIGPNHCYVRRWHDEEWGWFVVKTDTYKRIEIPIAVQGLY